jgi:hypothetical protein
LIKDIRDPEKPFTLEELGIITEDSIQITGNKILNIIIKKKTKNKLFAFFSLTKIITKKEDKNKSYQQIIVRWKPTVINCRLALNIGLAIRYRLSTCLSDKNTKIDIFIKPGCHRLEHDSNIIF